LQSHYAKAATAKHKPNNTDDTSSRYASSRNEPVSFPTQRRQSESKACRSASPWFVDRA